VAAVGPTAAGPDHCPRGRANRRLCSGCPYAIL
jgi:hypothetical protein